MHRPQTPQPGFGSITCTLVQKFTPHLKILDPRLNRLIFKNCFINPIKPFILSVLIAHCQTELMVRQRCYAGLRRTTEEQW